jgi:uncharacterized membrane protein
MHTFSIKEAISFGWDAFWKRPWFFIGMYVILGIVNMDYRYRTDDQEAFSSFLSLLTPPIILILIVVIVLLVALRNVVSMGEKKILLAAHDDVQKVALKDLWTVHPFWNFFWGNVLYGLIMVAGLILLIVPGIIWALKYMFVPYLIMDRGLKPMEAIRESGRMTDGHKWHLFKFSLVLIGVNVLGLLCLLIGLLVSIPVSALAAVFVYRKLRLSPENSTLTV